ncbi:hypothetical protein AAFF_G00307890 [Aldrovandia affinis]|uniref:Uncharacterized protein n=1 Tax=Aldrovandia affinis TaxID=143900 RepID=A0AAD7W0W8_9TELE|nr:hypothetical protein AAFF_G00307890 [Aldrovandia affinis]
MDFLFCNIAPEPPVVKKQRRQKERRSVLITPWGRLLQTVEARGGKQILFSHEKNPRGSNSSNNFVGVCRTLVSRLCQL